MDESSIFISNPHSLIFEIKLTTLISLTLFILLSLNLIHNSILFGDDWLWDAVREDVIKFSNTIKDDTDYDNLHKIHALVPGSQIMNDCILLYNGQWVLFKK